MEKLKFFAVILVTLCFHMSWASENVETNPKSGPVELRDVDTPPRVLKSFPPQYPLKAQMYFVEGKVILKFVVTAEGTAREVEVIESFPEDYFEKSAIEAVKKYRFSPAIKDGKPVNCIVKQPIIFSYDNVTSSYDYYKAFKDGQKQIDDGEYEAAIKSLSKAIKIYNKHSPAFYLRGLVYRATDEYKKALSDFNRAIKLDSGESVYYDERGVVYYLLEDFQGAIKDFDKAIELDPDFVGAYSNRGEALRVVGKYSDAIKDYTKVISMDEGNLLAYNNRGYCNSIMNDIGNTCADYKKACELGDCRGYDALKKSGRCLGDVSDLLETIQK